jgi:hypothetical protein
MTSTVKAREQLDQHRLKAFGEGTHIGPLTPNAQPPGFVLTPVPRARGLKNVDRSATARPA